jgi:hypothetical protein
MFFSIHFTPFVPNGLKAAHCRMGNMNDTAAGKETSKPQSPEEGFRGKRNP